MSYEIEILNENSPFDEWDSFVDASPQGCIFCRSWWLRTVCQNGFNILILRNGGRITAGIPLPLPNRRIPKIIQMPPLTPTLGVLLEPPTSEKYEHNLFHSMETTKVLIEKLPQFAYFSMNFHYNFTNWLPFYWAGYQQTTQYTYVIDDLTDMQKIYNNINQTTRHKIRKATNINISIIDSDDIETFLEVHRKTYSRQGINPLSDDFIKKVNRECILHSARKIFLAEDAQQRIHTAIFAVYDKKSMYNLLQGSDPELQKSGSNNLAIWHTIEFAQKVTAKYDFEGSMMPNVEEFIRSFGAIQRPYFNIKKDNLPWLLKASVAQLSKGRRMLNNNNLNDLVSHLKLHKQKI